LVPASWNIGSNLGRDIESILVGKASYSSSCILLAGGTKKRQQNDIETAQARWANYKRRKKEAR
jgi:hypothetical protein